MYDVNNLQHKSVTLPIYNKANLPPLVEGQIFIGTDGTLNFVKNGGVTTIQP
jgi:hypothetical protein